ncbi:MAG: AtpZ/AtpI family protein [Acidimicrobiia bacterium]|nr:AtpZ/AtpI family protein [Acidimicrobiia bacterium]
MVTNAGSDAARAEARLDESRSLYEGFGNALALAVELVAVPVIFLLTGAWLDRRLDTQPLLTIVLLVVAVVGMAVRSYYAYKERMRLEEEGKPWARTLP